MVTEELIAHGTGGSFVTEKFKHDMPPCLANSDGRSWVSGGWTSPCGVRPLAPDVEEKIVHTLIAELNSLYDLGLGPHPCMNRDGEKPKKKVKYLVIGGSHAKRESKVLVDRGYEVFTCTVGGWRPNKTAAEEMATEVSSALAYLDEGDVVIVHCFDNIAYMARTEEGGDLPIRRFPSGEYHVEGDLVLTAKERLLMYFKNCLPFLKLLEGRIVIFLTPLVRYLLAGCCGRADHAPNRLEDGFEEALLKQLADCRGFFKDFLFVHNLRGFAVVNPSLCVPVEDENGTELWGRDPIHPLYEGYNRIVDYVMGEADRLAVRAATSNKRPGASVAQPNKKPRLDNQRPRWVVEEPSSTTMRGRPNYGGGGGGGGRGSGGGYRGSGGEQGRIWRPRGYFGKRGGRGRG